jgi:hypothetical protein
MPPKNQAEEFARVRPTFQYAEFDLILRETLAHFCNFSEGVLVSRSVRHRHTTGGVDRSICVESFAQIPPKSTSTSPENSHGPFHQSNTAVLTIGGIIFKMISALLYMELSRPFLACLAVA